MEKNKTSNELVSIIVPVYNIEEYLVDTLESIITQDYENLELILVDDGSTDNSGRICDSFAEDDSRIRVIHLENSGVSHARNVGIKNSKGDYIVFCDSDDLVSPMLVSTLYNKIKETDADIVRCAAKIVAEDSHKYTDGKTNGSWTIYEENNLHKLPYKMHWVIWGKMYRKALLADNNITFDEGLNRGEDSLFAYICTLCCKRVAYSDLELVNYRLRQDSLMRSKVTKSLYKQSLHKYYYINDYIQAKDCDARLINSIQMDALKNLFIELINSSKEKNDFKENFNSFCIDSQIKEALKDLRKSINFRYKFAIDFLQCFNHPIFTGLCRNLFKLLK